MVLFGLMVHYYEILMSPDDRTIHNPIEREIRRVVVFGVLELFSPPLIHFVDNSVVLPTQFRIDLVLSLIGKFIKLLIITLLKQPNYLHFELIVFVEIAILFFKATTSN